MAKITPATGNQIDLIDHEAYPAVIKAIVPDENGAMVSWNEYPKDSGRMQGQVVIQLGLESDPNIEVRAYVKFKLGKDQQGKPQLLRQLCNAIAGKPATTQIEWMEDDTPDPGYHAFSWGYTPNGPEEPGLWLRPGLRVKFRGETREKKQSEGSYFAISVFQMPDPVNGVRQPINDDDEIPF